MSTSTSTQFLKPIISIVAVCILLVVIIVNIALPKAKLKTSQRTSWTYILVSVVLCAIIGLFLTFPQLSVVSSPVKISSLFTRITSPRALILVLLVIIFVVIANVLVPQTKGNERTSMLNCIIAEVAVIILALPVSLYFAPNILDGMNFQKIIILIFGLLLCVTLIIVGVTLSKRSTNVDVNIASCPDYWIDEDGPPGSKCSNPKKLGKCNLGGLTDTMDFTTATFTGADDGVCAKSTWAKNCGVVWSGVTDSTTKCT